MSKPDRPNTDIAARRAVALKWDGTGAPTVKAKGRGIVAEEIVALAQEAGVPMHEDLALVNVLSGLDLEQEIPPELYLAIAQILAFAYEVSGKTNPLASPPSGIDAQGMTGDAKTGEFRGRPGKRPDGSEPAGEA